MAGTCECGNEPLGSIKCRKFLTSCEPISFSRRTLLHGVSKLCCNIVHSLCTDSTNIAIQFHTLYITILKSTSNCFMLLDLMITKVLEAVNISSNTYLGPTDFLWMQFIYLLLVSSQSLLMSTLAPIFSKAAIILMFVFNLYIF